MALQSPAYRLSCCWEICGLLSAVGYHTEDARFPLNEDAISADATRATWYWRGGESLKRWNALQRVVKKWKKNTHQRSGSRLPSARKRGARLGLQVILEIYPPLWSVEASAAHSTFPWKTSVVQTYFLTRLHAWAELSQRSWQQMLLKMHSLEPVADSCD